MKKNILLISFIFIILILGLMNFNEINAVNIDEENVSMTKAYFLSKITATYRNGDCILLENIDYVGNKKYGLIDTGRKINIKNEIGEETTVVTEVLREQGIEELEFMIITHSHSDHNGDAISILENFNVKNLYMKEFDKTYSPSGTQDTYEKILKLAVQKNINIIGINYNSTISSELSPGASSDFIRYMSDNSEKSKLFTPFNKDNVNFKFGSSNIKIFNWEMFDENGNIYTTGESSSVKETVKNENANSLYIVLSQGNKKIALSGDVDNYIYGNKTIGDEDRIKKEIGEVDVLKLGHHGYQGSNTESYLKTLKPKYVVITNDVGQSNKNTISWFDKNNIKYVYTTEDKEGVIIALTDNEVYAKLATNNSYEKIIGKQINSEEKLQTYAINATQIIEKIDDTSIDNNNKNENTNGKLRSSEEVINKEQTSKTEITQKQVDNTTLLNTALPYAGKKGIVFAIVIVLCISVFIYIKINSYKDVK